MNFLQPFMLYALPLMALPIIIHLINQNRHRSVRWGGMMFLVSANRMNKGMARLKYVLIMLLRILAVAVIIFAVSRPLVSGKLGGLGAGSPDATLILLDRSASMEAQDIQSGESKRSTALRKLSDLLEKRGYGTELVLIDGASEEIQNIESSKSLLELPGTKATVTSSNIPSMLEKALAYLKANEVGRADVWICSDLKAGDWDPESGRWPEIQKQFSGMKGVQHFLLAYEDLDSENLAVSLSNIKLKQSDSRSELVLDVQISRDKGSNTKTTSRVPVEFVINKVRSIIEMDLDSGGGVLSGHRIPISENLSSGWGGVYLPGDANPIDNRFYFAFSKPPARKVVVVTDDTQVGEAFKLSLEIPSEPGLVHEVKVVGSEKLDQIDWDNAAMLVWQIPLPDQDETKKIETFINSGRLAMFLPPGNKNGGEIFGAQWREWEELDNEKQGRLSWWRGDADLLSNVGSGDPLPLKDLRIYRYCQIQQIEKGNTGTPLARLGDDRPLLTRIPRDKGSVYFLNTLPIGQYSSLERDAVAFYVMLQRALSMASESLSGINLWSASEALTGDLAKYEPVAPVEKAPTLSERGILAGVYRNKTEWVAVNRDLKEDNFDSVPVSVVDDLFKGLPYSRINDAVGDTSSLASEIWRTLLYLMLLALLLEALLCMPEKREKDPTDLSLAFASGKAAGDVQDY